MASTSASVHPTIKTQYRTPTRLADYRLEREAGLSFDIGYVRWSVDKGDDANLTETIQRQAIEKLRDAHGDPDVPIRWIVDKGKSGRAGKAHLRTGYQEMRRLIETGRITRVYLYANSRLTRDAFEFIRFAQLCLTHKTAVTSRTQIIDVSTPHGKAFATITAVMDELEGDLAADRNQGVADMRRARGDSMGQLPYGSMLARDARGNALVPNVILPNPDEPVDRVIEVYLETRKLLTTARQLNAEGIRTRRGGPWALATVRQIILRTRPDLLPPTTRKGAAPSGPFPLYQLLRCHCGGILTGHRDRGRYPRYHCTNGMRTPDHGRVVIAEKKLLPWVMERAAEWLAQVPNETVAAARDYAAEREALLRRKDRLWVKYDNEEIGEDEYRAKLAEIKAQIDKLIRASVADPIPQAIDWEKWTPIEINAVLREMWSEIQLGEDLLPVATKPAA